MTFFKSVIEQFIKMLHMSFFPTSDLTEGKFITLKKWTQRYQNKE